MLRKNVPMTVFLFLIMTLHTVSLGCLQWTHGFITKILEEHTLLYKALFYFTAIVVSLNHQRISKKIGLKMELAAGIISSALGMFILNMQILFFPDENWLSAFSMFFLGIAMLSVINCLFTYVVLVFSNQTLLGIIALFAFGNAGLMLAPQLLRLGAHLHMNTELIFIMISFLLMYGASILILFDEPATSPDPAIQSTTPLQKELPIRLPLYMIAIAFYGLIESTFSLWGEGLITHTISIALGRISSSSFWLSMVVAQALLLLLIRKFSINKLYYFMIAIATIALIWLIPSQSYPLLLIGFILGGIGCAGLFPTTLSFLMEEIRTLSHSNRDRYLSLIENGISRMTASYMLGISFTDLLTDWLDEYGKTPFTIAIVYVGVYAVLIFYLNRTSRQETITM